MIVPMIITVFLGETFSLFICLFLQGAIVFSNIVTTVSPSYAQEVQTSEVWVFFDKDAMGIFTLGAVDC